MPLHGKGHSDRVKDEAPYFDTLAELDTWFVRPHDKLAGVLPYQHRPRIDGQADSRPKLLVCHDYKGGYTESPSGLCYTFNFWPLCDAFVYFSHHRVTVPPSGWTNAAHKHGTRMLGTLIFEGLYSEKDCLQLVVGCADYEVTDNKIPVSKRYAVFLAELAYQRGFDGYLLNLEFPLLHGANQAHALAAWILLLKAELRAKVGPHAEVVWYDGVIYNGERHYQNRLNGYNLPFFLASDTLFTNYWWEPRTQNSMAQYFEKLRLVSDPYSLTSETSFIGTKTLQSIYSGVDVWPYRGQYGNSGYCCYRAITYTAPLGFSTALFAPAWTWESVTEKPEQNWDDWWGNDRKLWLGPLKPGEVISVPNSPEGPFKPMSAFFQPLPLPDPFNFAFYTNFSPGVGYSWFVEGKKVLDTVDGWTDIDKQTSIGNLVWPWPTPSWEGTEGQAPPTGSTALDMSDGYNGGNTLKLTLTHAGTTPDATVKTVWLPVQALCATALESFEACVVYKTTAGDGLDLDTRMYAKPSSNEEADGTDFSAGQANVTHLAHGWIQQTINFISTSPKKTTSVVIGFLIDIKHKDAVPAEATVSLSLGQLAVYPTPPPPVVSVGAPSVIDTRFVPAPHVSAGSLEGVLTWDTASAFAPINVHVGDKESVIPAWRHQDTPAYRFPTFVYFNVYAAPLSADVDRAHVVFIGTTGLDGRANRFYVEPALLPAGWDAQAGVRFYVQGVTDRGEVLPWDKVSTVDYRRGTV